MKQEYNWKKYRLEFTEAAEALLADCSLEEQIALMSGAVGRSHENRKHRSTHYNEYPYEAGGNRAKGIPSIRFVDGTHGVVCGSGDYVSYPVVSMRAASFDPELEALIGEALGEDVLSAGGNLFGGICLNVMYHPGWGRAQESYGEDSYLAATMGSALVCGVQQTGVIACIKHFAFHSMEEARLRMNIEAEIRAERETFLPHFQKAMKAGAGAVMSAYNRYQGGFCGQNHYLLTEVLKEEWQFDGFVLSDFNWGIRETEAAANAGMDLEMPNTMYYGSHLLEAVRTGCVPERAVREAAKRLVRTALAHEKQIAAFQLKRDKKTEQERHIRLARKSAEEGITLLRNHKQVLPLKGRRAKHKIVLLGALAEEVLLGDHGSSQTYPPYVQTALEAIRKAAGQAEIIYYSGENAAHCRRLSREADTMILFVGNTYREEGEYASANEQLKKEERIGGDRWETLALKAADRKMIEAVASERQDAVVVLYGGSAFTMDTWIDRVGAVLMCYYPGMEGAAALADVLFGKISPEGKLPFSIPRNEADLPKINWHGEEQRYESLFGYRALQKDNREMLFPFGFGLTYTEFQLTELSVSITADGVIWAEVTVKNCGKIAGAEVVQLYVGMPYSAVERPIRTLKGFQKVRLKAEESKRIRITCPVSELAYFDAESHAFVTEKGIYRVFVGTSCSEADLIDRDLEWKGDV